MPALHGESNLLADFFHEKGDVEKAFEESYLIVEDDFETPAQDHGYMEPDACFAYVENDRLMVYTSSQNVFADRLMVCRALGLAPEQVRVRAAFVGGGFGGKDGHTCQIYPNGDQIRSMSDDELARFLSDLQFSACNSHLIELPPVWLEWLRKEVDGDA